MAAAAAASWSLGSSLRALNTARDVYPAVVLVVFLACFVTYGIVNAPREADKVVRGPGGRPLPVRTKSNNGHATDDDDDAAAQKDVSPRAKLAFRLGHTAIVLTFIFHAAAMVLQVLLYRHDEWWPGQSPVIFVVGSFFSWFIVLISLIDTTPSPSVVHVATWLVSLPFELFILVVSLNIYAQPHREPVVGDQQGGRLRQTVTPWEAVEVAIYLLRILLLIGSVILYAVLKWPPAAKGQGVPGTTSEQAPLLGENGAAGNGHAYGTSPTSSTGPNGAKVQKPKTDAWAKPTEPPNVTWFQYLRGFAILVPYLWPQKSLRLQFLAVICFLIMVAQRVLNVFVPVLSGLITNALAGDEEGGVRAPWLLIGLYVLFRWLQGSQGILSAIRAVLWIPVEQYSYQAISTAAFEHVHNLDAEFHTGKRTGELISALNKGSAINSFLELVTFNVGPMILDLVVAVCFFTAKFDVYLGLLVAITTVLYIYVTVSRRRPVTSPTLVVSATWVYLLLTRPRYGWHRGESSSDETMSTPTEKWRQSRTTPSTPGTRSSISTLRTMSSAAIATP